MDFSKITFKVEWLDTPCNSTGKFAGTDLFYIFELRQHVSYWRLIVRDTITGEQYAAKSDFPDLDSAKSYAENMIREEKSKITNRHFREICEKFVASEIVKFYKNQNGKLKKVVQKKSPTNKNTKIITPNKIVWKDIQGVKFGYLEDIPQTCKFKMFRGAGGYYELWIFLDRKKQLIDKFIQEDHAFHAAAYLDLTLKNFSNTKILQIPDYYPVGTTTDNVTFVEKRRNNIYWSDFNSVICYGYLGGRNSSDCRFRIDLLMWSSGASYKLTAFMLNGTSVSVGAFPSKGQAQSVADNFDLMGNTSKMGLQTIIQAPSPKSDVPSIKYLIELEDVSNGKL